MSTNEIDFPNASHESWTDLVTSGPRGVALESLAQTTDDGLSRGPLFTAEDRPADSSRLGRNDMPLLDGRPWHIAAPMRDPDLAFANRQLLEDLKGGASAVRLEPASLGVTSSADAKRLFEGVLTELVPITIAPGEGAAALAAHLRKAGLHFKDMSWGLSPSEAKGWEATPGRLVTVNAAKTYDAGGTEVQMLAHLAGELAEALRALPANRIAVELATGPDAHLSLCTVRAARRLIARICEAFDQPADIPVYAVTTQRVMQSVDAWTNMLRVMSAGFAAITGGADMVCTRPFTDSHEGLEARYATPFGYRVARNMQLMMMEESHLGQVCDPAHGSYFHERLTEDLAQAAWTEFQAIESGGGWSTMGEHWAGAIQRATSERVEAPILGVTLHPSEDVPAPELRS